MSYQQLEEHFLRLSHLSHINAMVSWDEAVMMPPAAGPDRGEAIETLRQLIHEQLIAEDMGDLFENATQEPLSDWQSANLREMRRSWRRAVAIPKDLVAAGSRAESLCEQAWRQQRMENNWSGHRPLLEEVVNLKRQTASALADVLNVDIFEALLDIYEPDIPRSELDALFEQVKIFLPDLIMKSVEIQRSRRIKTTQGPFSEQQQQELAMVLMKQVGFNFDAGRLDTTHHPFCGGVPTDVRVTTRYNEQEFVSGMMVVLHETGHAKYEQNLPRKWIHQPVGTARSTSIHESQSLLMEMQICRSREFMNYLSSLLSSMNLLSSHDDHEVIAPDNLFAMLTKVNPGLIRVEADELSYPAHIILRYEIEKPLIEKKISVSDIPELWDLKMQEMLGLTTKDNYKDGCMQDVHWASGHFGYFPTYILGAMDAAQIYAAALYAHPEVPAYIERGDFSVLDSWLRDHIWSQASLRSIENLLLFATGSKRNITPYRNHLELRYLN